MNAIKLSSKLANPIVVDFNNNYAYFSQEAINSDTLSLNYYEAYHDVDFWKDLTSRERSFLFYRLATSVTNLDHFVQRGGKVLINNQNASKSILQNTEKTPHDQLMQSINSQFQTMISTIKSLNWKISTNHQITTCTYRPSQHQVIINRQQLPYTVATQAVNINDVKELQGLTQIAKSISKINHKFEA